jgi:hypothetical protein
MEGQMYPCYLLSGKSEVQYVLLIAANPADSGENKTVIF